jgi:DNA-binding NtrC family response regulator
MPDSGLAYWYQSWGLVPLMSSRVLFISPHPEDGALLSRMLEPTSIHCEYVANCQEARRRLGQESYGAILTEAYLPDGDWKIVLQYLAVLGISPAVVVTHSFADDRFWAEVLNLGCYDMLAQPFDTREVQRIVSLACAQASAKPPAREKAAAKSLAASL